MQPGNKGQSPEPLSENDKRLFGKYGKLAGGGLLAQKSKERTYFDSGDFALSAAHRVTDNGSIQTGAAHPHRESISQPYSPVPAASNANKDANEDPHRRSASPQKSPLHRQITDKHIEGVSGTSHTNNERG
ncbi:uncharacterized protein N7496_011924 [Penicillium cataractarum]|uniref:mRNA stability protein n=1 Tax=Penicillium cataractarum TaxID=2100454 RepID=A0A9W9RG64_9EURO|nr:uncharacterized protein N7496_011924 [Penicillium cataractarum]KAJ5359511.1 hypothetical protein N7496_011924 [Penicillium cataractarum]